jgi:hypothetical protein
MMGLRVAPMERLDESLLAAIGESLRQGYGIEVELGPALGEPAFAWDDARGQYNAPVILRRLLDGVGASRGAGPARLLAVTSRDLYIPMLSFVYGQAQLGGQVAVVSMARLRPEYYGLPSDYGSLTGSSRRSARVARRWRVKDGMRRGKGSDRDASFPAGSKAGTHRVPASLRRHDENSVANPGGGRRGGDARFARGVARRGRI